MTFIEQLLGQSSPYRIHNQTFFWFLIIAIYIGLGPIKKKMGIWAGLLFAWTIGMGVWVSCWGVSPHAFDLGRFYVFSLSSFREMGFVLLIAFLICQAKVNLMGRLIRIIAIADAFCLIFAQGHFSLFYVDSMDASFLASVLPVFWRWNRKWWVSIPLYVAIIVSGSSTALIASIVAAGCFFTWNRKTFLAVSAMGGVGALMLRHSLFHSSGRYEFWQKTLHFYMDPVHKEYWLTGFGTGSFQNYQQQIWNNPDGSWQQWCWPHNEFIGVLFCQGPIGLSLLLATIVSALWVSRKTPWLRSALVGFTLSMATQVPLRHFVSATYGGLLLLESRLKWRKNEGAPFTDDFMDILGH